MDEVEDAVLVERCLMGQRDAFEVLVARYWERLHVMIAHSSPVGLAPEDVVQEAFIQAYRKLATLRDPGRFGAWLYRIAQRICRARRHPPMAPLSEADMSSRAGAGDVREPGAALASLDARANVRAAVASLPERYRVVVTLRFFGGPGGGPGEGMSGQDIADHLGEPVGTVWTRLHRANRLLREKLRVFAPETGGASWTGGKK